tara:strand:- start:451 stop:633 length:183 start_codon:yes stop_codon:yes gene_type:complete
MVASENEMKDMVDIMMSYFPDKTILMNMLGEIWNDVGQHTDNESLRDTIIGIEDEIAKRE